jgi:hypothetical protein
VFVKIHNWATAGVHPPVTTLEGEKVLIEGWRREYNSPHSMMGYLPPASDRGGIVSGNDNVGGV